MTHVLQLADVRKTYPARDDRMCVLAGVTLAIRPGEVVWLRGASGSGKTTLLTIAGLLAPPDSGEVRINGVAATGLSNTRIAALRGHSLGFVFQQHNLISHLTAVENIVLPARDGKRSAEHRARSMLANLGLDHRADFPANRLSGGERQRIAIARALINAPAVVLADEPISGLDADSATHVLHQLSIAAGNSRGVLVASHDSTVATIADRTITLVAGRLEQARNTLPAAVEGTP